MTAKGLQLPANEADMAALEEVRKYLLENQKVPLWTEIKTADVLRFALRFTADKIKRQ